MGRVNMSLALKIRNLFCRIFVLPRVSLFSYREKEVFKLVNCIARYPSITPEYIVIPVLNYYKLNSTTVYKEFGARIKWMGDDQTIIMQREKIRPGINRNLYMMIQNDLRLDKVQAEAYLKIAAGLLTAILSCWGIQCRVNITSEWKETMLSGVLPSLHRLYESQISDRN